jgi:hypothetical protein
MLWQTHFCIVNVYDAEVSGTLKILADSNVLETGCKHMQGHVIGLARAGQYVYTIVFWEAA